ERKVRRCDPSSAESRRRPLCARSRRQNGSGSCACVQERGCSRTHLGCVAEPSVVVVAENKAQNGDFGKWREGVRHCPTIPLQGRLSETWYLDTTVEVT